MKKFKRIILIVYLIIFLNLLLSKNLLIINTIFIATNLYFATFPKLSQKSINTIALFELLLWGINAYIAVINNFDIWFTALNNLLWLLTSIKLIEVKNNINVKNIIILLLLSIGTTALFNISFASNTINLFCFFLVLYSLLSLNKYQSENFIKQLFLLLLLLPITLISIFAIPTPKPWLKFNTTTLAKTGLSNELRPGDISSLAQTEDLVGRIFFKNQLPRSENRYWRVFVLDKFENNTWVMNTKKYDDKYFQTYKFPGISKDKEILDYEKWILEPNYIKQRPWSGNGNLITKKLQITDKGTLLSEEILKRREEYQVIPSNNSWRKNAPKKISFDAISSNNKKLYNLSRKWLEESSNPYEIVEKAKEWFLKANLTYSINPGLMNKNAPYDDFLFKKKIGFCEHFAGSFALLMNYANIPSRVVIGYQGGEIFRNHENQQYILIDNSYAHAWNEIWIEDKGWIRIDPTAWVSPERIENSLLEFKTEKSNFNKFSRNINLNLLNNLSRIEISFNNLFDKINIQLNKISFSENKIINNLISLFLIALFILLTVILLLLSNISFANKNLIRINLDRYFDILGSYGIKKKKGETLKNLSLRIGKFYPKISRHANNLYLTYNNYKFSNREFSKNEYIRIFYKILLCEIKILSYIGYKNFKSVYFNFLNYKN
ncbi:transglutaminaseTgpA domain-containing protein [Prochlorococcus marinus]|uniref:transglutaminase family protein n=1 Tax=Prochlorococcus marinus TaxID=1219 RepID=UPI001ADA3DB3|nr:DUF3488 and transglutaminase-like domain-containing protein [Prochlorococcus marinus]MBO8204261.1 DUF3488 domain-containing transglutaminase family protein [Prochlorococcus marinus CUG1415]MBW3043562.1 hypothetical protein [Prochlorococcus marinus str. MU1415]